jgi:hypothetical protein
MLNNKFKDPAVLLGRRKGKKKLIPINVKYILKKDRNKSPA